MKKYCAIAVDDPLIVLGMLKQIYPKLYQYFKPDIRKCFDIAYRERN
jgi:hypothetical protein